MKQTSAVSWLESQLIIQNPNNFISEEFYSIIEIAKAMEKQQIKDAFGVGCQVESTRLIGYQGMAEQYFEQTFNKDKQ